ncbi:hypothetical protein MY11210_002357 [Beauveria gryllotalpidicola]
MPWSARVLLRRAPCPTKYKSQAKQRTDHTGTALFSEFFCQTTLTTPLPIDCGDISQINEVYASYADALGHAAAAEKIDPSLDDFQETFAPTPPQGGQGMAHHAPGSGLHGVPALSSAKVIGKLPYFVAKAEGGMPARQRDQRQDLVGQQQCADHGHDHWQWLRRRLNVWLGPPRPKPTSKTP